MKIFRTVFLVAILFTTACGEKEMQNTECDNPEDIDAIREELGPNAYHFPYILESDLYRSNLTIEQIADSGYFLFSRNRYCEPDLIVSRGIEIKVNAAYFVVEYCESIGWECVRQADIVKELGKDIQLPLWIEYAFPIEGHEDAYELWPVTNHEDTLSQDIRMQYPWYPIILVKDVQENGY